MFFPKHYMLRPDLTNWGWIMSPFLQCWLFPVIAPLHFKSQKDKVLNTKKKGNEGNVGVQEFGSSHVIQIDSNISNQP